MQGCGEVLPRALSPAFAGTGYSYEETGKFPASVGLKVLLKVIIALKTILHYFQCSDFIVLCISKPKRLLSSNLRACTSQELPGRQKHDKEISPDLSP